MIAGVAAILPVVVIHGIALIALRAFDFGEFFVADLVYFAPIVFHDRFLDPTGIFFHRLVTDGRDIESRLCKIITGKCRDLKEWLLRFEPLQQFLVRRCRGGYIPEIIVDVVK